LVIIKISGGAVSGEAGRWRCFMHEEVRRKLKEVSREGKVTCAQAEKIAEESRLSRLQVGKLINELDLKITSCQLGCF